MITSELILNILLILIVAWILGSVFTRFGLPVMLGELLAGIILGPPLLTQDQFSALVLMAFVTTLIAPITLRWAVMRSCSPDEKMAFCSLWERAAR